MNRKLRSVLILSAMGLVISAWGLGQPAASKLESATAPSQFFAPTGAPAPAPAGAPGPAPAPATPPPQPVPDGDEAPAAVEPTPAEEMFQLPEVKKKIEPVPENLFAPSSPNDPDEPVITLSEEALETYVTFFPARSTRIGVGSFEQNLGDYRKASLSGFLGSCKGYLARLDKLPAAPLTEKGRVEREALRVYLRSMIHLIETTSAPTRDPNFYVDESVGAIQAILDYDASPALAKTEHLLSRMSILKTFFAIARQNLENCSKPAVRRAIVRLRASAPLLSKSVLSELRGSGHPQASKTGPDVSALALKHVQEFADWLEKDGSPRQ